MPGFSETRLFGRHDRFAEGWYWALASADVPRGTVRAVRLLGRPLAVYRGEDGVARALDAHCPHMGAHLAEGKVDGNGLRCLFHGWKYEGDGRLVDIPCQARPLDLSLQSWPVAERYGLIWVYTGSEPRHALPEVPELEGLEVSSALSRRFEQGCHPNIAMVNAIDVQHFTTVHNLPAELDFAVSERDDATVLFSNRTAPSRQKLLGRLLAPFYRGPLTIEMSYRFGATGTVTVGPDFTHFHIMFCLRPTDDGKTEGRAVLLTRRRAGVLGQLWSAVCLALAWVVRVYFAHGDTRIFQSIRFSFQHPIAADAAVVKFIKHLERQRARLWSTWEDADPLVTIVSNRSSRGASAEGREQVSA